MQSIQQQEAYKICFSQWLEKNDVPVGTKESHHKSSGAEMNVDQQAGAGGRSVATQESQINNITLNEWLVPSLIGEDQIGVLVLQEQDEAGRPWESYPEAIVEHPTRLTRTIIQKICRELHSLAKWMKKWDDTIAKGEWEQIRDRGRHGHCRESNNIGVCESWDPCVPNSKPKFVDE